MKILETDRKSVVRVLAILAFLLFLFYYVGYS